MTSRSAGISACGLAYELSKVAPEYVPSRHSRPLPATKSLLEKRFHNEPIIEDKMFAFVFADGFVKEDFATADVMRAYIDVLELEINIVFSVELCTFSTTCTEQ